MAIPGSFTWCWADVTGFQEMSWVRERDPYPDHENIWLVYQDNEPFRYPWEWELEDDWEDWE